VRRGWGEGVPPGRPGGGKEKTPPKKKTLKQNPNPPSALRGARFPVTPSWGFAGFTLAKPYLIFK